jgi:hypothetical protein
VANGQIGTYTLTATAAGVPTPATLVLSNLVIITEFTPPPTPLVVSGRPDGTAQVFDPTGSGKYGTTPAATLSPFPGFAGSVRAATGDVNGDRVPDFVLVTGPGGPVRFAVVNGKDNSLLVPPTDPFGDPDFTAGAFVAAGDLTGDGLAEFVFSPDQGGGPNVVIYGLNRDGALAAPQSFFALGNPGFRGGTRVAIGDVNADGAADLAVGAGFLGGPNVEIHDGQGVRRGDFARLIGSGFFAFDGPDAVSLRNGVFLAIGDTNGDGFGDLIAGGGPGGGPRVLVLSGKFLAAGDVTGAYAAPLANFFFGDETNRGGVRVAAVNPDPDRDPRAEVTVGSGEGVPSRVRVYPGKNIAPGGEPAGSQDLDPFGATLPGGVFVG